MAINHTRILVTGGAGAIGSQLVSKLLEHNNQIVVLDDFSSGYPFNLPSINTQNIEVVKGSITSTELIENLFRRYQPQIIFHLAAFFANQNSIEHPSQDLQSNGQGTLNLLEACRNHPIQRFIYAASSSSYGSEHQTPFSEELCSQYLSTPYQITKQLGEQYGFCYAKIHQIPFVSLRLFNSYGPGECPGRYRNVIPNFIFRALTQRPLTVYGDGLQTREFTYVDDVIEGLIAAATRSNICGQAINLSSGHECHILPLAESIINLTESNSHIIFQPQRHWDSTNKRSANLGKSQRLLNFSANTSLEEGLLQTIQWFRKNWEHINELSI